MSHGPVSFWKGSLPSPKAPLCHSDIFSHWSIRGHTFSSCIFQIVWYVLPLKACFLPKATKNYQLRDLFLVLGVKPWAPCIPHTCSTTELHHKPKTPSLRAVKSDPDLKTHLELEIGNRSQVTKMVGLVELGCGSAARVFAKGPWGPGPHD